MLRRRLTRDRGARPAELLPRWVRWDAGRLAASVDTRTAADPARASVWRDVAALVVACDELARQSDRDAGLAPRALTLAEQVSAALPPPAPPIAPAVDAAAAIPDADADAGEALAALLPVAHQLLALLTAPPDARDLLPELTRVVNELVYLLSAWTAYAEFTEHVVGLLRDDHPPPR